LKSNTPRYISFHYVSCVNKPHVIKYASRMQAQKEYFYSAFFTFIFLWFTRLYLFCPLFLFFMFTYVEFQVRIMLHFEYSIFYIKPQTISVVKCNDIALNSCAVLLSFFCNWWNGGRHLIEFKQDQYFSRMATNRSTFNFIQYSTSWYILIVY
jgi:hypothetical protein